MLFDDPQKNIKADKAKKKLTNSQTNPTPIIIRK